MYYKLSVFTQKLTGSSPAIAYNPQGLQKGVPAEPPAMTFATPTKVLSEGGHMEGNRFLDLQRIFQTPGSRPFHLKRRYPDTLLYRTTMALTIGGFAYCLVALYINAQPKKN